MTSNHLAGKRQALTPEDSERLRRFLRDHVTSFEELETLLFLARAPERAFSLSELSASLRLPEDGIENALRQLCNGLVSRQTEGASPPCFRYGARPELDARVQALQ